MKKPIKRRDFLKIIGGGAFAFGTLPLLHSCFPGAGDDWLDCSADPPSENINDTLTKVVEISDSLIVKEDASGLDESRAANLFKSTLLELSGSSTLAEAWAVVFPDYSAGQKVGIKVNTLNSKVPTRKELVKAMVTSLINDFSLSAEDILVWDRRTDELVECGFTREYIGAPCYGTINSATDKTGPGYEEVPVCLGTDLTYVSNILLNEIDYMINFAVLKNHLASGITACMKNNYGCIQNPENFHSDFENSIPLLNNMEVFKTKTKLFVVDCTFAVCAGDTSSPADCLPGKLMASLDPVSIDYRSKLLIDEERSKQSLSANPDMAWIARARNIGLGSTNIDLSTGSL